MARTSSKTQNNDTLVTQGEVLHMAPRFFQSRGLDELYEALADPAPSRSDRASPDRGGMLVIRRPGSRQKPAA